MRVPDAQRPLSASASVAKKDGKDFFLAHIIKTFKKKILTHTAHRHASSLSSQRSSAALSPPQSRLRISARPLPERGLFPPLPRLTLETVTIPSVLLTLGHPSPSQLSKGVLEAFMIV